MVYLRSRGLAGGPRRPRQGPRRAVGALPAAPGAPGARAKKLKTHTVCRAPLSGRGWGFLIPNFSCWGVVMALLLRGNQQERWGASPPTFPDGFPGDRRSLRPQKSTKFDFYLSAPFGAAPFTGTRRTRLQAVFGARECLSLDTTWP